MARLSYTRHCSITKTVKMGHFNSSFSCPPSQTLQTPALWNVRTARGDPPGRLRASTSTAASSQPLQQSHLHLRTSGERVQNMPFRRTSDVPTARRSQHSDSCTGKALTWSILLNNLVFIFVIMLFKRVKVVSIGSRRSSCVKRVHGRRNSLQRHHDASKLSWNQPPSCLFSTGGANSRHAGPSAVRLSLLSKGNAKHSRVLKVWWTLS